MRPHLVVAATALAVAGLATPAEAADVPLVGVTVPRQIKVVEGRTATVAATVSNTGSVPAKAVMMQLGSALHPVADSLGLRLPAGCDAQGCVVGDLAPGASRRFTFTLTGGDDTAPASTFDVTVGGAAGVLGVASPVTVVHTGPGVDLDVAPVEDVRLSRGESAEVPVTVRNAGTVPVDGVGLVLATEPGLEAVLAKRACEPSARAVICRFGGRLAPGAALTAPLRLSVAGDAGGPHRYSAALAAVGSGGAGLRPAPGAGERQAPGGRSVDPAAGVVTVGVRVGSSSADSAAVGGAFTGAVGDRRTVRVGVRNAGPGGIVPPGADWRQTVRVTVPSGVRLTAVDDDCAPAAADPAGFDFASAGTVAGAVYSCVVPAPLGSGGRRDFTFAGEITGTGGEPGSVIVDGGGQDATAANNAATLTVRRTDGGRAGTGWITLGGVALLVLGAVAYRVARRRRPVTGPPAPPPRRAAVRDGSVPRQRRPVVEVFAETDTD